MRRVGCYPARMRRRAVALLALLPLIAPGLALAVATLTASPNTLGFQSRCVFTSAERQDVRLTNTDDEAAALNVRVEVSPSALAGVFPLSGTTVQPSLGPGDSVEFGVGFRPEAAGQASGRAVVRYDAVIPPKKSPRPSPSGSASASPSASPNPTVEPSPSTTPRRVNIPISGRGIERFAAASPGFVNFGALRVGRRTPTTAISILDDGDMPLTVTRVYLSGRDAADFTLSASTPVQVREGSPARVQVGFRPREVGGRIASLVIESDSCGGTLQVPLAGIGVEPDIVTGPLELDFGKAGPGEAKRDFLDVINQGGLGLTVASMEIEGDDAAAFEFRRLPTFPHDLAPGQKIEARVTMRWNEPGPLSAKIVITSNDPDDDGVWEVPVTGEILAPSPSPTPTATETVAPPPPPESGGFDLALGAYIPEIAVGAAVVGFFMLLVVVRRLRGIPE